MTTIFGAGIAGLMAGCAFQSANIIEAGPEGSNNHKALLRFRSSAVGDAVGIEFRKVRVHKGIYDGGKFVEPNIQLANQYSNKVIGRLSDRSIWHLDPADRFIAPENFIEQLIERCGSRIQYNTKVDSNLLSTIKGSIISTIPMGIMLGIMQQFGDHFGGLEISPEFKSAPIRVERFRIRNSDVFQTIYIPDPEWATYRASITGSLLIVESVLDPDNKLFHPGPDAISNMFGIDVLAVEPIDSSKQSFGKIAPINDEWRKQFQFHLTHMYDVYSLGRFGTWRNILLDDVLQDLAVIKKLMGSSLYDVKKSYAKG